MTLFGLCIANLKASPLSTAVNILLLGLGTTSIAILLLANAQFSSTLSKNAAGIDLVIGAKGSPLQLVLSGVYHADVPPGNVPLEEIKPWQNHPMVDSTIPMSLGDSFSGYRIVGTTKAYPKLYNGMVEAGAFWEGPLEAVIGSRVATTTGLSIGDTFAGVHGLADAGQAHEDSTYKIVGTFNQTDTILDSLIVTSLESVWRVHGDHGPEGYVHEDQVNEDDQSEPHDDDHAEEAHHDHDEHHEDHDHDEQDEEYGDDEHHDEIHGEGDEITLALVKLSSPLGMMSLPREINEHSMLQAASPASEISRLLQIVGIGINWLNAFAVVLVISAALSIFAALYTSLHARRQHLAVMRCLGATRWELFNLLLVEGLLLTTAGIIFGLTVAHGGLELVGQWLGDHQGIRITGAIWTTAETMLAGGLLIAGTLIALLPAWQAYRTDVAQTLSKA